jgi:hypothetical protein
MTMTIPSLLMITALGLSAAAFAQAPPAGLQSERPQPVDSAQKAQDPEQRVMPTPKPADPVAGEKRSEISAKSFDQLDADKDGKVLKNELGADEAQGMDFSRIDKDSDGAVSRDEWNAYWADRPDKR